MAFDPNKAIENTKKLTEAALSGVRNPMSELVSEAFSQEQKNVANAAKMAGEDLSAAEIDKRTKEAVVKEWLPSFQKDMINAASNGFDQKKLDNTMTIGSNIADGNLFTAAFTAFTSKGKNYISSIVDTVKEWMNSGNKSIDNLTSIWTKHTSESNLKDFAQGIGIKDKEKFLESINNPSAEAIAIKPAPQKQETEASKMDSSKQEKAESAGSHKNVTFQSKNANNAILGNLASPPIRDASVLPRDLLETSKG